MIVYFVRHGAVENPQKLEYGRLPGFPLSRAGRAEAAAAAENLVGRGVEVLYASPLLRTRQTAKIIQKKLNVPLFYDDLLLEFEAGAYAGIKEEEYVRRELWRYGGETLEESGQRIVKFLDKIKQEGRYQVIALVTHEGPVVTALLSLASKTEDDYHTISFPTGGCLKLVYPSTSPAQWDGAGFRLHKEAPG